MGVQGHDHLGKFLNLEPLKHNLAHFGEENAIFHKENNTITWSLIIDNYSIPKGKPHSWMNFDNSRTYSKFIHHWLLSCNSVWLFRKNQKRKKHLPFFCHFSAQNSQTRLFYHFGLLTTRAQYAEFKMVKGNSKTWVNSSMNNKRHKSLSSLWNQGSEINTAENKILSSSVNKPFGGKIWS